MIRTSIFTDQTDNARAARREIAKVDCDIEGMADDAEIEQLCEKWRKEGISSEEFIKRLISAVKSLPSDDPQK